MQCSKRTFRPDNKEDGHTCSVVHCHKTIFQASARQNANDYSCCIAADGCRQLRRCIITKGSREKDEPIHPTGEWLTSILVNAASR